MPLVGLSRHQPPPKRLILPSGHSSFHLSYPNQEPVFALQHKLQTRGYMLQRHDVVNEDQVIHQLPVL